MRGVAAGLTLALLLSGCGGDGAASDGIAGDAAGAGGEGDAQLLRLSPTAGDSKRLRMSMDISMEMAFGDNEAASVDMPTIGTILDVTVDDVDDRIGLSYVYGQVEASGGDPQAAQQVQQALDGMEGMRGTATLTDRGELVDASVEGPAGLDPMLASLLDQMEQQLGQLTIPFPEDPVAVGDSWEASTSFELSGVSTTLDAQYTLRHLEGEDYTIDIEYTQTTSPGPIEGPNGEVVGEIIGGQGRGSGEMRGSLRFPLPERVTMESISSARMRIQGAPEEEIVQDVEMTMRLEPTDG